MLNFALQIILKKTVMSLVGKKFPNIAVDAMSSMGDELKINIFEEATKNNKKVLLFWYPKDFSHVCPTELYAFQEALPEFEARNTIVIGASCDTIEVHKAWLNTPKNKGGIEGITYPIISDSCRTLAEELSILDTNRFIFEECEDCDNVTYRATYLVDENGKVFHESINDMSLGRNINEYLRLIDAYTHTQKVGELCPANWKKGDKGIKL